MIALCSQGPWGNEVQRGSTLLGQQSSSIISPPTWSISMYQPNTVFWDFQWLSTGHCILCHIYENFMQTQWSGGPPNASGTQLQFHWNWERSLKARRPSAPSTYIPCSPGKLQCKSLLRAQFSRATCLLEILTSPSVASKTSKLNIQMKSLTFFYHYHWILILSFVAFKHMLQLYIWLKENKKSNLSIVCLLQ